MIALEVFFSVTIFTLVNLASHLFPGASPRQRILCNNLIIAYQFTSARKDKELEMINQKCIVQNINTLHNQ